MLTTDQQVCLTRKDHDHIHWLIRNSRLLYPDDRVSADQLKKELKKSVLFDDGELPPDVVRLGSTVTVKELEKGQTMQFTIVTPDKSDLKNRRVSVLSPVGTALIGLSKGNMIRWRVPAGEKTFLIEEVIQ